MNRNWAIVACLLALLFLNSGGGGVFVASPAPGSGIHVAVFEDRSKRESLPPGVREAMFSSEIVTMVKKAGGTMYLLDPRQDTANMEDAWLEKAAKLPRTSLPWSVIDNNGRGESGPLQTSLEARKAFVQKYLK